MTANVHLHYVIDLWAERWRRREASGGMIIVRYADDLVVGFELEADARRFLDAMRARLEEFAPSLHPDKTRIIEFGPHAAANRARLRRGNRDKTTWQQMAKLADDDLPKPRILHPWPEQRFAVKHPRWEPYAGKPHVGFCAGGAP